MCIPVVIGEGAEYVVVAQAATQLFHQDFDPSPISPSWLQNTTTVSWMLHLFFHLRAMIKDYPLNKYASCKSLHCKMLVCSLRHRKYTVQHLFILIWRAGSTFFPKDQPQKSQNGCCLLSTLTRVIGNKMYRSSCYMSFHVLPLHKKVASTCIGLINHEK
jgi:hypothetical protein